MFDLISKLVTKKDTKDILLRQTRAIYSDLFEFRTEVTQF
jgi:hypothetical protein